MPKPYEEMTELELTREMNELDTQIEACRKNKLRVKACLIAHQTKRYQENMHLGTTVLVPKTEVIRP